MENKLAEYRARKAREAKINEIKLKTTELLGKLWKKREKIEEDEKVLLSEEFPEELLSVSSDEEHTECFSWLDLVHYFLWFVLWAIVYWIFIELQFGIVFLIVSALLFIFFNTRTRPKKSGEISAYSVFNKNCESIDGTLKAEQFEKEIRYGHL